MLQSLVDFVWQLGLAAPRAEKARWREQAHLS